LKSLGKLQKVPSKEAEHKEARKEVEGRRMIKRMS
jgi:hypothetical protein